MGRLQNLSDDDFGVLAVFIARLRTRGSVLGASLASFESVEWRELSQSWVVTIDLCDQLVVFHAWNLVIDGAVSASLIEQLSNLLKRRLLQVQSKFVA
mmetsp:Transcript_30639/g.40770  ORF Transcript_30639/g.40770 Transcript_30639/m.40770 type:complete len:98 (-) Transcript_30639:797-1090(-)